MITLASGENNPTIDAGIVTLASLGNFVFNDENRNGQQDAGEAGVDGVTVNLLQGGNQIATATTAGGGLYLFEDLAPGDYVVEFTNIPTGFQLTAPNQGDDATDSDAAIADGRTGIITLASGDNDLTNDAGIFQDASLGNFVFTDTNGNGQQDAGEPGVDGVVVNLILNGTEIATTTTAGGGIYNFGDLQPGDYIVEFVAPAGTTFTTANQGDDASDSDADETTGQSPVITLASGDSDLTIDAGIVAPASLGNFVFNDENRNGQQDAGEAGVDGVTVNLLQGGNQIATATTAGGGLYLFEDLAPGDYVVEFTNIPTGFELTTPNQGDDATDSDAAIADGRTGIITLASGDEDLTNDAGIFENASLGNFVFNDTNGNGQQDTGETGIDGVVVNLIQNGTEIATTTTAGGGIYNFGDLQPGDYIVEFVAPAGTTFTTANQGDDASDSDADEATGQSAVITLASGENNPTIDAGIVTLASLGNFVFNDENRNGQQDAGEAGVDGVTVNLLQGGNQIATATTAGGGLYLFEDLAPGDYIVEFTNIPTGFELTTPNQGDDATDSDAAIADGRTGIITLASGDNDLTNDAGIFQDASLGDFVFEDLNGNGQQDTGEPGIGGVTVKLLDENGDPVATTVTLADGSYNFGGLAPGDYTVEFEAPTGTTFTTANTGNDASDSDADPTTGQSAVITLASGENNPTIDAGIVRPASLGNFVFDDLNNNGQQDAGEDGVDGVTVTLFQGTTQIATATTTGGGLYLFEDLAPGDYIVEFSNFPTGFEPTTPNVGDDATDSDAAGNGRTGIITLASGDEDLTNDAGIFQPNSSGLGDFVFQDTNANGIQDPDEPGVEGATVMLLDENGDMVAGVPSQTTGEDGAYLFSDIAPGDYQVKITAPEGFVVTFTGSGTDPELDSDIDGTGTNEGISPTVSVPANTVVRDVDGGLVPPKPTTFVGWQLQNPLGGENGDDQNADLDAFGNVTEYATCMDPSSGAKPKSPLYLGVDSATGLLGASFNRIKGIEDTTFALQFSTTGGDWVDVTTITPFVTDNLDGTETVTYPEHRVPW